MKLDTLHTIIGEWGCFQRRIIIIMSIPILLKGFQIMVSVVILHVPDHRCQIPAMSNDTYVIQDDRHRALVDKTIPEDENAEHGYAQCTIFKDWNDTQFTNGTRTGDVVPCDTWVYDWTEFDSSFIAQFDLVCEKKTYRAHIYMAYNAGTLLGSPISGFLCDWLGRKTIFCIAIVLSLVIGLVSVFPPSVQAFIVYRFFQGAAGTAIYLSAFVLVLELVGPTKRTMAGSLLTLLWLMGPFTVATLSYIVRDWQYLQLISSLPLVLCLGHWWLLPESPRWLLSKGKTQSALKVLRSAARVNKRPLLSDLEEPTIERKEEVEKSKVNVKDILRQMCNSPRLLVRMLIISFNWFVVNITYYGLSLNVGNLGGSLRLNFLISCTMELAGYITAWLLLERLGRKRCHCSFLIMAGLACLATILTVSLGAKKLAWATTALAMLGKLAVSASFTAIYLITVEIFPTFMRNFSMGCCLTIGTMGAMVSPYIADLALYLEGRFARAVPLVIFGGLAVLAGLLALSLPETLHRKLPDTLKDAVNSCEEPALVTKTVVITEPESKMEASEQNSFLESPTASRV